MKRLEGAIGMEEDPDEEEVVNSEEEEEEEEEISPSFDHQSQQNYLGNYSSYLIEQKRMEEDIPILPVSTIYQSELITCLEWHRFSQSRDRGILAFGVQTSENTSCLTIAEMRKQKERFQLEGPINPISSKEIIGSVTSVEWLSGDRVMCSTSQGEVIELAVTSGRKEQLSTIRSWNLHSGPCTSLKKLRNEDTLISVGEDASLSLLHTETGNVLWKQVVDGCSLNSVCWNEMIGVASSSGRTTLWDNKNMNRSAITFEDGTLETCIQSISSYPYNCNFWITGTSSGLVYVWDKRKPNIPTNKALIHESNVWKVEFCPQAANYMVSCSDDGRVVLTDYNSSKDPGKGLFAAELDNLSCTNFIDTEGLTSFSSFSINPDLGLLVAIADDATFRARLFDF